MNLVCQFLQIFIVLFIVNTKLFLAFPVENGVYPLNRLGRLLIKPFPAIENLQSDLYEVFMEPYGYLPHGSPSSPIRHIGDLGNIEGKQDDVANYKLVDALMSLVGPRSIVGRALVITSEEDDLGKYSIPESMTIGSSGKPIACAVISYIN
ncbi:superoxide dismutase cu-zn -related [Holotrichia oblita]|uniref:Superoxide dismutase cu-zn -related n=1 Tax=Holotrichia oblita TaxID=644536 RepID=A0ACB9T3T8_HOLOL|nr:superoxide dismutase cu-zn -related [Holotrichia oblita]